MGFASGSETECLHGGSRSGSLWIRQGQSPPGPREDPGSGRGPKVGTGAAPVQGTAPAPSSSREGVPGRMRQFASRTGCSRSTSAFRTGMITTPPLDDTPKSLATTQESSVTPAGSMGCRKSLAL